MRIGGHKQCYNVQVCVGVYIYLPCVWEGQSIYCVQHHFILSLKSLSPFVPRSITWNFKANMGKGCCLSVAIFTYDVLGKSHWFVEQNFMRIFTTHFMYTQWMQILSPGKWGSLKSNCIWCSMWQNKVQSINLTSASVSLASKTGF